MSSKGAAPARGVASIGRPMSAPLHRHMSAPSVRLIEQLDECARIKEAFERRGLTCPTAAIEGGLLVPSYEGLQVPTQVNYVAKAAPIYQPGEAVPGSTSVITRYLRTAYLWDAVRVQGGAYGCSLGFSRFDGVASFSSYRDPNVKATLDNYDGTGAFLRSNPLGPAELSKAIIGAVGDLDAPQSVDAKGYTSMVRHMLGVTEEDRQVWRDQVLSTTAADFVNFAERIDTVAQQGSVAAVASERAIAEANEALPEGKRLVPKAAL